MKPGSIMESTMEVSQKTEFSYDPGILSLGIYPKDSISYHLDACMYMFLATLFIITREME